MGYTKLFDKLVRSSIWDEDDKTRIVWITLLALADKNGHVIATENYLRMAARIDQDAIRLALHKLSGPDPATTTADNEGRRIQAIEGGWALLNHAKYRQMMRNEDRREYQRSKQAEYRARDKAKPKSKPEPEPRPKFIPPTLDEVKSHAIQIGLAPLEAEKFHAHYETNGWRTNAGPMKSWTSAMRGWQLRGQSGHQKPKLPFTQPTVKLETIEML